ncbi:MAG: TonB-dependent receptor [Cystobacterineae bacterium]|nr:TonB-dependent receptor [Cystobacterineae bacterium]
MERRPQAMFWAFGALLLWTAPTKTQAQSFDSPDVNTQASDTIPSAPDGLETPLEETQAQPEEAQASSSEEEDEHVDVSGIPKYETVVVADPYDSDGTSERLFRRSDIERQGAHSVADVLEQSPAVHATSGRRNERIFSIRGFEQRQTAVLIDGAPASIAYDGQVDLGMMPQELVDAIIISRGPGTLAIGPTSLGPTVNIITRRPGSGPAIQGQMESGWPGTWRGFAMHSKSFNSGGYTLYGGGEQSQGFSLSRSFEETPLQPKGKRINSDRAAWFLGGSAVIELTEKQKLFLSANFVDGERGVPPSTLDDTVRYWRFNVWRSLTASLRHVYRGRIEVEGLVYARLYDNLLDGYDDNTFRTQNSLSAFHSWFHDSSFGWISKLRAPLPEFFGLSSEARAFVNVAYERHSDASEPEPFQHVLLTAAPELSLRFVEQFSATLGCQMDAEFPIDLRGEKSKIPVAAGPLLFLQYKPFSAVSFGATVARRHRFPSLRERFSRGFGTFEPNPNLQPESAWHFNLETSWRLSRWLSLELSGFDAEVSELIEAVYLGSGLSQRQNIHRARLAGAEVSARAKFPPWFRAEFGYAYQFARQFGGQNQHLPYRPMHKAVAEFIATPWNWLECSTSLRYVGGQAFQHPSTLRWGTLTGYMVWDGRVEGRWQGFALYARVSNILDTFYQTEYGFPNAGRQVWVGMKFAL